MTKDGPQATADGTTLTTHGLEKDHIDGGLKAWATVFGAYVPIYSLTS